MTGIRLLNLLAASSLAIMACSFGATPVNALSSDLHHVSRHMARGHDALAMRKRSSRSGSKRCKPRPSSLAPAEPKATPKSDPPQKSGNKGGAPSGPPPASHGNTGGKFGLAWANGDGPDLAKYKTGKYSPIYTWSPFCPSSAKSLGFNCIPMLWGPKQTDNFQRLVKKGYANTVLGFNEPNQSGQSDISPQYGAQLWQQYIQPLKFQGYDLISPATTSAPSGYTWMQDFFGACKGCTFDGVAVHWYDVNPQAFITYIKKFHDGFGHPIWVTEYACQNFNGGPQCSKDATWNLHQTVTGFMDGTSWVAAYFPFGVMHDMQGVNPTNQMMASGGGPNDLGNWYLRH